MGLVAAKTVIGLEIGKKRYSWCQAISPETGDLLKQPRLTNSQEEFSLFVQGLPRPIRLVMEATDSWRHLYECWEKLSEEIHIAHPLKTKAIASARIKTDRKLVSRSPNTM